MKPVKLSADIKKSENIQKAFFWGLWFINAFATAVFGAEYLPSLFSPLVSWLPGGDAISSILAVIASLVVFDVAYQCWASVGEGAETSSQRNAAVAGEWTSFLGSLAYTAITFATYVFPNIITSSTAAFLSGLGGFVFIAQVVTHLVLAKTYLANSIDARKRKTQTKTNAAIQSEQLAYHEEVIKQALLVTKGTIDAQVKGLSEILGADWAEDAVNAVLQFRPEKPKEITATAAPTVIEGEKEAPAAQPAQASPNLAENAARVAQPPTQTEPPPATEEEEEGMPVSQFVGIVGQYLNGHGHGPSRPNSTPSPFGD